MKKTILLFSILLLSSLVFAQNDASRWDFGGELQAYPAGLMFGVRSEVALGEPKRNALNVRVGYNAAWRHDWGEHQDERGGGWGGSLGYRHYFSNNQSNFFLGLRTDIWQLKINWKDGCSGENCNERGETDITVLQPTGELGWRFKLGKGAWSVVPTVSYGLEINVITKGEPVGQGDILLAGISLVHRL